MARKFVAAKAKVNGNTAPDDFLNLLVDTAISLPDSVFEVNQAYDIYSLCRDKLGPWGDMQNRRAVMCTALWALASLESSYDWTEGKDPGANNTGAFTQEAGIFQCSANSMFFDKSLQTLFTRISGMAYSGSRSAVGLRFQELQKTNHAYAVEHCMRLVRFTINHHGPLKRGEILPYVSKKIVAEFEAFFREQQAPTPMTNTPWLDIARGELGVHEIRGGETKRILEYHATTTLKATEDEVAWCASFAGWCLQQAGYAHQHNAWAQSYASYGEKLSGPRVGCIVPFRWNATSGHVGFCVGFGNGYVDLLGGNQSNANNGGEVSVKRFSTAQIMGYRWPVK